MKARESSLIADAARKSAAPQHTPGPWRVGDDDSFQGHPFLPIEAGKDGTEGFRYIAEVTPTHLGGSFLPAESRANATLIAEAPALLEATATLLALVVLKYGNLDTGVNSVVSSARATINRATGHE